jgi:hypothetical protein
VSYVVIAWGVCLALVLTWAGSPFVPRVVPCLPLLWPGVFWDV